MLFEIASLFQIYAIHDIARIYTQLSVLHEDQRYST